MSEDKEELWMIPVMVIIKKKDAINAFEAFQDGFIEPMVEVLEGNDDLLFMFNHGDMVKHVHDDSGCIKTPISKEDTTLIEKLTLPLEVLQKIDAVRNRFNEVKGKIVAQKILHKDDCVRCEGKGKVKEGMPPIVEIRKCPDCDGTGKKKLTHGEADGSQKDQSS